MLFAWETYKNTRIIIFNFATVRETQKNLFNDAEIWLKLRAKMTAIFSLSLSILRRTWA